MNLNTEYLPPDNSTPLTDTTPLPERVKQYPQSLEQFSSEEDELALSAIEKIESIAPLSASWLRYWRRRVLEARNIYILTKSDEEGRVKASLAEINDIINSERTVINDELQSIRALKPNKEKEIDFQQKTLQMAQSQAIRVAGDVGGTFNSEKQTIEKDYSDEGNEEENLLTRLAHSLGFPRKTKTIRVARKNNSFPFIAETFAQEEKISFYMTHEFSSRDVVGEAYSIPIDRRYLSPIMSGSQIRKVSISIGLLLGISIGLGIHIINPDQIGADLMGMIFYIAILWIVGYFITVTTRFAIIIPFSKCGEEYFEYSRSLGIRFRPLLFWITIALIILAGFITLDAFVQSVGIGQAIKINLMDQTADPSNLGVQPSFNDIQIRAFALSMVVMTAYLVYSSLEGFIRGYDNKVRILIASKINAYIQDQKITDDFSEDDRLRIKQCNAAIESAQSDLDQLKQEQQSMEEREEFLLQRLLNITTASSQFSPRANARIARSHDLLEGAQFEFDEQIRLYLLREQEEAKAALAAAKKATAREEIETERVLKERLDTEREVREMRMDLERKQVEEEIALTRKKHELELEKAKITKDIESLKQTSEKVRKNENAASRFWQRIVGRPKNND